MTLNKARKQLLKIDLENDFFPPMLQTFGNKILEGDQVLIDGGYMKIVGFDDDTKTRFVDYDVVFIKHKF